MSNALPACPGGYFTNGMVTPNGSQLSASSRVPVDTGIAGGETPQSGGIIPGTQIMFSAALTALAGGGKTGATQLGYGVNRLSVCATAANSALLPYAFPGALAFVKNDGAASATVYGKGTDTIDGIATATGNAQANAKGKLYFGTAGAGDGSDAGAWVSLLSA